MMASRNTTRKRKTAQKQKVAPTCKRFYRESCGDESDVRDQELENPPWILRLPVEIILHVLTFLPCRDLKNVSQVNAFFHGIVGDAALWKNYEVVSDELTTVQVINELKKMPMLRKIKIESRGDIEEILEKISKLNKHLEVLQITDCTGSTSKLYLRAACLNRILERCKKLHTIYILNSRFRGKKFYRLLANRTPKMRSIRAPATFSQFQTFLNHTPIDESDRQSIMSTFGNINNWAPLQYFEVGRLAIIRAFFTSLNIGRDVLSSI